MHTPAPAIWSVLVRPCTRDDNNLLCCIGSQNWTFLEMQLTIPQKLTTHACLRRMGLLGR
jgi:hypothetical protein